MIKVIIPTALQTFTAQQSLVSVEGKTVGECLKHLVQQYHRLQAYIYNDQGHLSCYCNTYLNNQDVRYLAKQLETEVVEGDKLEIIPSMAGG